MLNKRKIVYVAILMLLLIIVNIVFVNAVGILYADDKTNVGPGVLSESIVVPIIDVSEVKNTAKSTTSTISASRSDVVAEYENGEKVYEHDGIKYYKGELVGNFGLSGYCACKKCGTGTGLTASGKKVRENHTIAADWNILPKNTMIILENAVGKDGTIYDGVYQVEDRGGGIKNKKLDIYRPTHELAALVTNYGRCYGDVYIALPINE